MQTPPARLGDSAADIDTPALVVDLDVFERNLDLMANALRGAAVALRPHGKAHKCPDIALAQIERGAVGICCQKVGEAEAFVAAGVRDVLVTNEIVGAAKLARLAAMAKKAKVGVLADDAGVVREIGAAASAAGVTISVLVEINVGANRCGVAPGAPAVGIAQEVARTPGLTFGGIQAYHGGAQHLRYAGGAARRDRAGGIACPRNQGGNRGGGRCLSDGDRCRNRHLAMRARQRRLHGGATRVIRLHGRRLPEKRAGAGPASLRAEPVRAGDGDERGGARAGGDRRRVEGIRRGFGSAAKCTACAD